MIASSRHQAIISERLSESLADEAVGEREQHELSAGFVLHRTFVPEARSGAQWSNNLAVAPPEREVGRRKSREPEAEASGSLLNGD